MLHNKKISRIGLFDSGIGGLTVLKDLLELPHAEFLYVADTANVPYGQKTPEQILQFSTAITHFLISQKIDALVIACHTSSALALPQLQKTFPTLPIIGTIMQTMMHATKQTKNGRIGIMATQASINSHLHKKELLAISPDLEIFEVACPKLVPLIEAPTRDENLLEQALLEYLTPLIKENIDTLILGCTHYPLLAQEIQKIIGDHVTLISSGSVIAQELHPMVDQNAHPHIMQFFVTGDPESFEQKAGLILDQEVRAHHAAIHTSAQGIVETQSNLGNTIQKELNFLRNP